MGVFECKDTGLMSSTVIIHSLTSAVWSCTWLSLSFLDALQSRGCELRIEALFPTPLSHLSKHTLSKYLVLRCAPNSFTRFR